MGLSKVSLIQKCPYFRGVLKRGSTTLYTHLLFMKNRDRLCIHTHTHTHTHTHWLKRTSSIFILASAEKSARARLRTSQSGKHNKCIN